MWISKQPQCIAPTIFGSWGLLFFLRLGSHAQVVHWTVDPEHILRGVEAGGPYLLEVVHASVPTQCALACLRYTACTGYNFQQRDSKCQLREKEESALRKQEGTSYYRREALLPNDGNVPDCGMNGLLLQNKDCLCQDGFYGQTCDQRKAATFRWGEWVTWSSCSVTCGPGWRLRHRKCNHVTSGRVADTSLCEGEALNVEACQDACPTWSKWGDWDPCSTSIICGKGVRRRFRQCTQGNTTIDSHMCGDIVEESKPCKSISCNVPVRLHGKGIRGEGIVEMFDDINHRWGHLCGDYKWNLQAANVTCRQLGHKHGALQALKNFPLESIHDVHIMEEVSCIGNESHLAECPHNLLPTQCNVPAAVRCIVDGFWDAWSDWGLCSQSCGGGNQVRSRDCVSPQHGGLDCMGNDSDSKECDPVPCPVDGILGMWSEWSECSVSCEAGSQSRDRQCTPPQHGGAHCVGNLTEEMSCNMGSCPVDGVFDPWSMWGDCSSSCGPGTRSRNRTCTPPIGEGADCLGDYVDHDQCDAGPCPVDGLWSEWGAWDACTASCAGGEQKRARSCQGVAYEGKECEGKTDDTQNCNEVPCPIDGIWEMWSEWGDCIVQDCGDGTIKRERSCDGPFHKGLACVGPAIQKNPCEIPCEIPGEWENWGEWSQCSATCGGGSRTKRRVCDMTTHGDKTSDCIGESIESQPCNIFDCMPLAATCQEWMDRGLEESVRVEIKPAASTLWVKCNLDEIEGTAITEIEHDQTGRTHVQGYESSGEFKMPIQYTMELYDIEELMTVLAECRQFIKWECRSASIKNTLTPDVAMTFWVSRNYEHKFYWGGADPTSEVCACGMDDSCDKPGTACNCDANDDILREDSGYITSKDDLPIIEFRAGDTGASTESGYSTIGPLLCFQIDDMKN